MVFSYDPVGWGVPYGTYMANGNDEDLVDVALQVLCVVMDFDPKSGGGETALGEERTYMADNSLLKAESDGIGYRFSKQLEDRDPSSTLLWGTTVKGVDQGDGWLKVHDRYLPMILNTSPVLIPHADSKPEEKKEVRNVFRYMLQNISKDAEIDLVFGGLVRLLSTVHKANQTYLPNSVRSVGFYQEALVLLWHLITLNQAFTKRIVDHCDTNQILLPVLYLMQQAQNAPQLVGLLHTASFVLLMLSSERSFAVKLNEPYSSKIPLVIPTFQGSHADVVALTLYKAISDSIPRPQNDALVEMLLTVLCNVSPYIKSFALESCLKMLSLVDRCSKPCYLFRSAFTHHGMTFLLEMLNNVIQYQFEGNSMLVYSVLRQKECFQQLVDLKLSKSGAAEAENGDEASPATAQAVEAVESAEAIAEGADVLDEESWVPTEGWLAGIKKKMPLQTILCLVEYLAPRVEEVCKANDVIDQEEVLKYLKQSTMVGILPVPHPIVIRTYQASSYTSMWFTSYMWGVIFTRSQRMPLYDWKKIRLVVINQ